MPSLRQAKAKRAFSVILLAWGCRERHGQL